MRITIKPLEEREARWREVREAARGGAKAPPRPLNLRAVIDLGGLTLYTFRGRAYGVPPLPWKEGVRLNDLWLHLRKMGDEIPQEKLAEYESCFREMARLVWRNTRPTSKLRRLLKALHITRNPFDRASEIELAQIALFYLGRRMMSTGAFRPMDQASQAI